MSGDPRPAITHFQEPSPQAPCRRSWALSFFSSSQADPSEYYHQQPLKRDSLPMQLMSPNKYTPDHPRPRKTTQHNPNHP